MIASTRPTLSSTLISALMLSFIGAKGCLGGDVSLGYNGEAGSAGLAGNRVGDGASGRGVSTPVGQGGSEANDAAGALGNGTSGSQAVSSGGAGGSFETSPLTVDANGRVSSSSAFAVSGVSYSASDGADSDGSRANGACERAGHASGACSVVTSPSYSAPGVLDWGDRGPLCCEGVVARVLSQSSAPGSPDYGSMWGSAIGFDFRYDAGLRPYDASAHGVIGIAFDIDAVPPSGLRVELRTPISPDEPAAWLASLGGPNNNGYVSPVRPGRNVVLFQDAKPLPFYTSQAAFDPTQLLAMQFHVPATTEAAAPYSYCISNLSLILGTPPASNGGNCAGSENAGFEYDATAACVSLSASLLTCANDSALLVPSMPAINKLPCVRRLSDSALFIALRSSAQPQNWQSLPESAWSHVSGADFADCTADEAALVAAAPLCPVNL